MSDRIEAETNRTRTLLAGMPKMRERLRDQHGEPAPRNLYDDDPEAVAECACMDRADEPEVMVLEARIRVLETALAFQADRIGTLITDRDRYIDWNSELGAKNERLSDQNADLSRRSERQAASINSFLAEAAEAQASLRQGVRLEKTPGAHLIWWPDGLPIPAFGGKPGAESVIQPRLSASWEHLPDPCVAPVAPGSPPGSPPGSLGWALRQSHTGRHMPRL